MGILEGLKGDIEINLGRPQSRLPTFAVLARALANPQVRACLLVRLAARPPRGTGWLWRNLLITLHSIDVGEGAVIAPGLRLPHPYGIAIAANARIGPGASIGQHVTLSAFSVDGEERAEPIVIGSNVKIYTNSTFTSGVEVGDNAVIGSHALVTSDVEPGGVVRAHSKH